MKRILSFLLSLCLLFVLIGCGREDASIDSDPGNSIAAEDSDGLSANSRPDKENSRIPSNSESSVNSQESSKGSSESSSENSEISSDSHSSPDQNSVPSSAETESHQPASPDRTESQTPSHVHSYVSETVQATCTEGGYTKRVCSCGDTIKENYTQALGHSFGDWHTVEEATTSKKGLRERFCRTCQLRETEEIPQKTAPSFSFTPTSAELEMLQYINQSRKEAGLNPLTFDIARGQCADVRAREIQQQFSHTRPNGGDCFSVLDELGLSFEHTAGENIQYTPSASVADAHQNFMNSEGHRNNILKPTYTSVAIRICESGGTYYIVEFFFG